MAGDPGMAKIMADAFVLVAAIVLKGMACGPTTVFHLRLRRAKLVKKKGMGWE